MTSAPRPLAESDRMLLREYAGAVTELLSALDGPGADATREPAGRKDFVLVSVLEEVRSLTSLQEHSLALRARVLARVREALIAGSS